MNAWDQWLEVYTLRTLSIEFVSGEFIVVVVVVVIVVVVCAGCRRGQ